MFTVRKFTFSVLAVLCIMVIACATCSATTYADLTCDFRGKDIDISVDAPALSSVTVYHGGQVWFDIDGNTASTTFNISLYVQKKSPTGLWFYNVDELTVSNPVTLDNTSKKKVTTKKVKKTSSFSNTIKKGTVCRYKTDSGASSDFYGYYRNILTTSKNW